MFCVFRNLEFYKNSRVYVSKHEISVSYWCLHYTYMTLIVLKHIVLQHRVLSHF